MEKLTEEKLNEIFVTGLEEKPTFSEGMIKHIKSEVDKITKEAIEWHKEYKKDHIFIIDYDNCLNENEK